VTGVTGIGIGWHGNDVVGNSTVVLDAPLDVTLPEVSVVEVVVDTTALLPPHALNTSAAQHPAITTLRTASILASPTTRVGSLLRFVRLRFRPRGDAVHELSDTDIVIVEAVRSPLGKRNGGLATVHPADLLGLVQRAAIERAGIDPIQVGQVIGGCVSQVGEQTFNIARTAWLSAGLPLEVAGTTVDSQCGSSQQATNLATAMVGSGVVDVALACGIESMSRVPLGAAVRNDFGRPNPPSYQAHYELTSQFEGAERIADKWGVTRADCDEFGLMSQQRAQQAWTEGHFEREVLPVDAPDVDADGKPNGSTHHVARDEGLRETSLEALAKLKPVGRENGVHTAGSSSQITDGAAAVLVTTVAKARELGLRPRARIVDQCLVGVDPVLMLTGPIDATRRMMERTGLTMDDFDTIEINEAFASVVLAWEREVKPDMDKVNPNGGAIALGHPVGATGARLITTALHELERTDGQFALVTMCCGGGLGTGTVLERV
jgi:acetyl-CoA C-acetyltransferase